MKDKKIDGTMYTHPTGLNGHGAGPLIGLLGLSGRRVPGRGDAKVVLSMWFSIEPQATTPVPEWGGQPARMAQEEDMVIGADGKAAVGARAPGSSVPDSESALARRVEHRTGEHGDERAAVRAGYDDRLWKPGGHPKRVVCG